MLIPGQGPLSPLTSSMTRDLSRIAGDALIALLALFFTVGGVLALISLLTQGG